MSCESCGCESDKVVYRCNRNPETCPAKEVNKDEPVPKCCGIPMKKKKKYSPPPVTTESIFEQNALACGKTHPQTSGCQRRLKKS